MTQIRNIVEQVFETDLLTPKRNERRVLARKAYCYLMRRYTDCSLTEIGDSIGLNHSTVIHHCKHPELGAEAIAKFDKYFRDLLSECENQINELHEDEMPFKSLLQRRLDALRIGESITILITESGFELYND